MFVMTAVNRIQYWCCIHTAVWGKQNKCPHFINFTNLQTWSWTHKWHE